MADHSKPVLTDNYTDVLSQIRGRLDDQAKQFDPAVTSATNIPVGTVRWNSASTTDQKWNGTGWVDKSSNYSFNQITLTGGAVNSIPYLNGSKVLTTSSSLTFDGTNFGVGTSSPEAKLHVSGGQVTVARFGEGANGASIAVHNRLAALPTTGTAVNIAWLESTSGYPAGSLLLGARPGVGQVVLSATGAADVVIQPSSGSLITYKDATVNGVSVGRGGGVQITNTAVGSSALVANTTGYNNFASGYNALYSNTSGFNNTASGADALFSNTTGNGNTAIGQNALQSNTTGFNNTASGAYTLRFNTTGINNTSNGAFALFSNIIGNNNTASGTQSLYYNTTGIENAAFGFKALYFNTTGDANTACGTYALQSNTTGSRSTATGFEALKSNTTGVSNTAVGSSALKANTTGASNTAVGSNALALSTSDGNTAVGSSALYNNTTNNGYSTAVGTMALYNSTAGFNNTAVGAFALSGLDNYYNCSALGNGSSVTGSNQIQLGDSSTTTYVYGTVQNRSDLRDKTDVRDTLLGLEFINGLRAVDYRWDMREDYKPAMPVADADNPLTEEDISKWRESCKLANIKRDGSKKRSRYHHGLIAQDVKALVDKHGIDFGGLQDHSLTGGDDVLSIGYDELIAPLIKAVQELSARIVVLESDNKKCIN